MKRYSALWATAVAVLALAGTSMASSMTFATFADPSSSNTDAMFTMASDYSSISGGWTRPGLTLNVPFASKTFTDVQFQLHGSNPAQPGYIDFWTSAGPLMRINYTSATLSEFSFGARDTTANPGRVEITYYPWGAGWNPTNETFSFSFSNIEEDTQGNLTATAAFSSSAIPEPATAVLLALGCLGLIRRR